MFHFHTSPGGASDLNNFIPLVERYGKRVKLYLVHFGGGVSGHIRLVPRFLDWVEQGYKVYTDITWAVGFGVRWLAHRDRAARCRCTTACCSPPTSRGATSGASTTRSPASPSSKELKDRILYQNFEALYGHKW